MMRRALFGLALLLITAGALAFRLPDRGNRPIHGDEAVHAFKFAELWQTGKYTYDPNEFHGPTLYYATLPEILLAGRKSFEATTEADYRLVTVLFGAGMLLLLALLADGLGKRAALWSALLLAISPAFVFYSRYYIQETLLAFFTLGALACGYRYLHRCTPAWVAATGLFAGLMIATKETAVITFAVAALSLWLTRLWNGRPLSDDADRPVWTGRHAVIATVVAFVVAFLFLSAFFTNLRGPIDLLRSYTPWVSRAHSTNLHQHPWRYYLEILIWTHRADGPVWNELLIVGLSVVGMLTAFFPGRRGAGASKIGFVRFMALYTVLLTAVYSAIPYKTPWCVLSFLLGMILLAGVGADTIVRLVPTIPLKAVAVGLLLLGGWQLGRLSYRTSYEYYADGRNPYVYAQTQGDMPLLARQVLSLSESSPDGRNMVVQVLSSDPYYWPLPWYLRGMHRVGYYVGEVPKDLVAPVIIASGQYDDQLTPRLDATHQMPYSYGIRRDVIMMLWVNQKLWADWLKTHKPLVQDE